MGHLARKLSLARDHVGWTGHRSWVLEEHARLIEGTADWAHRFGCLGCSFEVYVSMAEMAEEGRLDLLDRYGLGAELEAICQTPPTERREAWDHLLGEDSD